MKRPFRFKQWVEGVEKYRYFSTRTNASKARDKVLHSDFACVCGNIEKNIEGKWEVVET